jgi:hypothetical protein
MKNSKSVRLTPTQLWVLEEMYNGAVLSCTDQGEAYLEWLRDVDYREIKYVTFSALYRKDMIEDNGLTYHMTCQAIERIERRLKRRKQRCTSMNR